MASFTASFRKVYNSNGTERSNAVGSSATITDGEANSTFEAGDALSGSGVSGGLTYAGTFSVTVNSVTYQLFVGVATNGRFYVYGNIPAPAGGAIEAAMPNVLPALDANTSFTVCFAAGTMIGTPEGDRAVEALKIGDMVLTTDGRAVPVRWLGRQTKHKALAADFAPVRVKAGALGAGLPQADLVLTGSHALIVDGLAINAAVLVNGTTIVQEALADLPDTITYYHVETEHHEEILANGAPAETFIDYIDRASFDNHQEYLDLYGVERIIPEMKRQRISARRQLPADIAARFGIAPLGHDVDQDAEQLMERLTAA